MPTNVTPVEHRATRESLHRVAVHVIARRRTDATGRFGLRATPGGFGTPAFGGPDHDEVLRVAGSTLVREQRAQDGTHAAAHAIDGASLAALATFAGADLAGPLSVGSDTPAPGDPDLPLTVNPAAADRIARWFHLGACALDATVAARGPGATASVVQLWPEHFDLACDVAAGATRANLGASPGDGFHEDPYVYVGPWTADRPGDPAFWNAPFGAVLGHDDVFTAADPIAVIAGFFTAGLDLLVG